MGCVSGQCKSSKGLAKHHKYLKEPVKEAKEEPKLSTDHNSYRIEVKEFKDFDNYEDFYAVPMKLTYSLNDKMIESNQDLLSIGTEGLMFVSGIDENGAFFELKGRFTLAGEVYMQKKFIGLDDELIILQGIFQDMSIKGKFNDKKNKVEGEFIINFIGTVWNREGITVIISNKGDKCGIGKDNKGYGLWIFNKDKANILYADGTQGTFIY